MQSLPKLTDRFQRNAPGAPRLFFSSLHSCHKNQCDSIFTVIVECDIGKLIKFFSVVAVMFLPPTLIASVYGMNFDHIPELDWPPAYPIVLGVMVFSMILPYVIFRRKGWL